MAKVTTGVPQSRMFKSYPIFNQPGSRPPLPARHLPHLQLRHATFIPRSRRPYQFTQLIQLSDGSTYTVRTTSPAGLHRAVKDSRNHILWQPSDKSLRNVEVDEAGKLAAFRQRFGRSWDLQAGGAEEAGVGATAEAAVKDATDARDGEGAKPQAETDVEGSEERDPFESLEDLITGYAAGSDGSGGGLSAREQARRDRPKKK
jgi:hypothetical protein